MFFKEILMTNNDKEQYILRLYIAGNTTKTKRTIQNLKRICDDKLKQGYELEIIDIQKHPEYAKKENIIATPTLIKQLPLPIRNLIGDMSDKEKVLVGLELVSERNMS